MWINKEYKKEYLDSSIRGIRVKYSKYIDNELKIEIKRFMSFLRKEYYFPIRCTIWIKEHTEFFDKENPKKTSLGDFYYYDEKLKKLPFIWVATGYYRISKTKPKKFQLENILFTIVHELTHYFQWYFLEIDKRTDRSLEIEANRWAYYLIEEYSNKENERNQQN